MEGENKESVPEFKEEIVILDKPGVIRGGRPKNPKIKGKKKILGKIGLKENVNKDYQIKNKKIYIF